MKDIFLIGKFNAVSKNIYKELSKYYQMQLCSDEPEIVKGMFWMKMPDLILILTMDMTSKQEQIFLDIKQYYPFIPVICIGTKEELNLFAEKIEANQWEEMVRPITNSEIIEKINQMLEIEEEESEFFGEDKIRDEKKNILLIDDSAVQLRMMKGILKDKYKVSMAKSAGEALKIIQKNSPDLIFLDYDMPDCDGKQTLQLIRERLQKDKKPDIPVVFLTGVKDKKRIRAVLGMNPAAYILKPISQEKLMKMVIDLLGE